MIKKLLLTLGLAGITAGAFAQATINFDNIAIPSAGNFFNPPLVQINGTNAPNAANSYTVALYWSSNSVAGGPAITPGTAGLNLVGTFASAPGLPAGKFNAGAFTVNGLPGASTGFFEVVGWSGNSANYATALGANALIGATPVFSAPTGTAGSTSLVPGELTGWTGNLNLINPVPEPTTIALGGLGVAALLLFRRRK